MTAHVSGWVIGIALVIGLFFGLRAYADDRDCGGSALLRTRLGALHAILHLAPIAALILLCALLDLPSFIVAPGGALLGAALGPVAFAIYLRAAHATGAAHATEVFSGLSGGPGKHFKNFLRIRVDKSGAVTIYPIGIRRVPELDRWRATPEGEPEDPWFELADDSIDPELIEPPIVLD
jgi:hypothetical protein